MNSKPYSSLRYKQTEKNHKFSHLEMNWQTCIYSILWNWIYFSFEQITILLNKTNEYKIETILIFSKAKMVHFTFEWDFIFEKH